MKARFFVVSILFSLLCAAVGSQTAPSAVAAGAAGCYRLRLGQWTSSNPQEPASPWTSPPEAIRLVAKKGPGGPGRDCGGVNGGTVYPCKNSAKLDPHFQVGCWSLQADGSLVLTWTNMMEGVQIILNKKGGSWTGHAQTTGDAGPGAYRCDAVLVSISCD